MEKFCVDEDGLCSSQYRRRTSMTCLPRHLLGTNYVWPKVTIHPCYTYAVYCQIIFSGLWVETLPVLALEEEGIGHSYTAGVSRHFISRLLFLWWLCTVLYFCLLSVQTQLKPDPGHNLWWKSMLRLLPVQSVSYSLPYFTWSVQLGRCSLN